MELLLSEEKKNFNNKTRRGRGEGRRRTQDLHPSDKILSEKTFRPSTQQQQQQEDEEDKMMISLPSDEILSGKNKTKQNCRRKCLGLVVVYLSSGLQLRDFENGRCAENLENEFDGRSASDVGTRRIQTGNTAAADNGIHSPTPVHVPHHCHESFVAYLLALVVVLHQRLQFYLHRFGGILLPPLLLVLVLSSSCKQSPEVWTADCQDASVRRYSLAVHVNDHIAESLIGRTIQQAFDVGH
jgi:hypothetical protein